MTEYKINIDGFTKYIIQLPNLQEHIKYLEDAKEIMCKHSCDYCSMYDYCSESEKRRNEFILNTYKKHVNDTIEETERMLRRLKIEAKLAIKLTEQEINDGRKFSKTK